MILINNKPLEWYFMEIASISIGVLWVWLSIFTNTWYIGFLGLVVLYRRLKRVDNNE